MPKPRSSKKRPVAKKRAKQKESWWRALLFAVTAAVLVRWGLGENYVIPSASMEGTLLTGDVVLVSKLHYGARTPKTPLQLPLTHQYVWGTRLPAYFAGLQLPVLRLPGLSRVKRGDIVVFNYPPDLGRPLDLRTYYIKRCVALPGDRVQLREGELQVNGRRAPVPTCLQHRYFLPTEKVLPERLWREYGIAQYQRVPDGSGYVAYTSLATLNKLQTAGYVHGGACLLAPKGATQPAIYGGVESGWNEDHFGPLQVPKKGMEIPINAVTLRQYGDMIEHHEGHAEVHRTEEELWIGDKLLSRYTFRRDYYFMLGDNRHNSKDSRFIGFVPADHIVGKGVRVLFSIDSQAPFWYKLRWRRIGKKC